MQLGKNVSGTLVGEREQMNKRPAKTTTNAKAKAPHKALRKLTRATMIELYAVRRYLGLDTLKETGLRMPVDVYFKDPRVAKIYKTIGIDPEFTTPWEPGLRDGPTSARFAVVDYDSTSNTLTPPAKLGPENEPLHRARRNATRQENHRAAAIPPVERLGDGPKHSRLLRERVRARPTD